MSLNENLIKRITALLGEENVFRDEPMARHTTLRTGGPADLYCTPDVGSLPEFIGLLNENSINYPVIGNGSNLLVSDSGIRGVVIEIGKGVGGIELLSELGGKKDPDTKATLRIGAGELLSRAASFAAGQGLSGMEALSGIPGSVGGAVYMNAGAYDGEMSFILKSAEVLKGDGSIEKVDVRDLKLSYRHSALMDERAGDIVLAAEVELTFSDVNEIRAKMEDLARRRREKQPLEYPSAGSTFKRPEGYFAGKLIEDAGLKGFSVGGAMVSEKHCGFVINYDHASSLDIKKLMDEVSRIVFENSGVTLVPEVRLLGEW